MQRFSRPLSRVEPYETFHEAIRQVNESVYGLQAGVFTRDAGLIQNAFDELEVGGLIVGDVPSFRVDQMPYGGVKDSGLGREGLALLDRGHDRAEADGNGAEGIKLSALGYQLAKQPLGPHPGISCVKSPGILGTEYN